jgi:hypothetical protein
MVTSFFLTPFAALHTSNEARQRTQHRLCTIMMPTAAEGKKHEHSEWPERIAPVHMYHGTDDPVRTLEDWFLP